MVSPESLPSPLPFPLRVLCSSIPGWLAISLPSNPCSDVAFSGRSTLDTQLKTATSLVSLPCCVFYSTSVQFNSDAQSCPTLCDPITAARQASLSITNSRSLLSQVCRVGDAIQPSHPLTSPYIKTYLSGLSSFSLQYITGKLHKGKDFVVLRDAPLARRNMPGV